MSSECCMMMNTKNGIPELPEGGYNTGLVIELKCHCPSGCPCGANTMHKWTHAICKS